MTRKRFVKLLMACGMPRNLANDTADAVRKMTGSYTWMFCNMIKSASEMKEEGDRH